MIHSQMRKGFHHNSMVFTENGCGFRTGIGTCITKCHGGFHTRCCFLVNGLDVIGVENAVIKEFFAVPTDRKLITDANGAQRNLYPN